MPCKNQNQLPCVSTSSPGCVSCSLFSLCACCHWLDYIFCIYNIFTKINHFSSNTTDVVQAEDFQSVWEAKARWGPGGRVGGGGPLCYSNGQLVPPEPHLLCGWHLSPHHPVSLQQIWRQHSDSGEWDENQNKGNDILVIWCVIRSASKVHCNSYELLLRNLKLLCFRHMLCTEPAVSWTCICMTLIQWMWFDIVVTLLEVTLILWLIGYYDG